ncbi:MAG: GNAT family N-acetyltransferase [Nanoarchaeota archaeon]
MQIRKFKLEDAQEVSSLITRAITERDNKDYTLEQITLSASYYTSEIFCEDIAHKNIYVSTDSGKIIGTATLHKDEIMACFILPEHQRKGIGRAFLSILERDAVLNGLSKVWLVAVLPVVGFYEKLGYHRVGEKMHKDWGKGIIMEKYVRKD